MHLHGTGRSVDTGIHVMRGCTQSAMLALLPRVWRGLRTLPVRLVAGYAGIGALVALHWLTFYGAVKLIRAGVLNATVAAVIALCIGVTACIYVLALQGLWQFDPRHPADADALEALMAQLPKQLDGVPLQHALDRSRRCTR